MALAGWMKKMIVELIILIYVIIGLIAGNYVFIPMTGLVQKDCSDNDNFLGYALAICCSVFWLPIFIITFVMEYVVNE